MECLKNVHVWVKARVPLLLTMSCMLKIAYLPPEENV